MSRLSDWISSEQFEKDFAEYEQGLVNDFGSTSKEEVLKLHDRLEAARDFYAHIRERYQNGQE